MTEPASHALLAGATGLVGRELAASWDGPGTLHLLVRRPLPASFPMVGSARVHEVDFASLPALPAADEAYCCLGTTIAVAGSQAAFRAVDFDAVLAFATAARRSGVKRFALVSALGADPRSSTFYSRVKGQAEQALQGLGFDRLVIARPSLLSGDRAALGQAPRPGERFALALTRPLAPLIPKAWRPIPARSVAVAMRRALRQRGARLTVIESGALVDLGA